MKRILVLAMLLVPAVAQAQVYGDGTTADPGKRTGSQILMVDPSDSTRYFVPGDRNRVWVSEYDRDRDKVTLFAGVSGVSLAAGASDSTAVGAPLDVHAYRYLKLLIKIHGVNVPNAATSRVAIQLREQANGALQTDTTSTFAEYLLGSTSSATATAAPDTINFGHLVSPSATAAGSGEFVVTVQNNRATGGATLGVIGGYPNGISVPLESIYGRPARFNKLAIRIRNIGTGAVAYNIQVLGFAQ